MFIYYDSFPHNDKYFVHLPPQPVDSFIVLERQLGYLRPLIVSISDLRDTTTGYF